MAPWIRNPWVAAGALVQGERVLTGVALKGTVAQAAEKVAAKYGTVTTSAIKGAIDGAAGGMTSAFVLDITNAHLWDKGLYEGIARVVADTFTGALYGMGGGAPRRGRHRGGHEGWEGDRERRSQRRRGPWLGRPPRRVVHVYVNRGWRAWWRSFWLERIGQRARRGARVEGRLRTWRGGWCLKGSSQDVCQGRPWWVGPDLRRRGCESSRGTRHRHEDVRCPP